MATIDTLIDVLGIVVLGLYGLVFMWAMARVFSIADDTRTMVVLLRRSLDIAAANEAVRKEDADVEGRDVDSQRGRG